MLIPQELQLSPNKVFGKLGLFNPIIAFCHVDFALLHNNSYKHSLMPLLEINPL